MLDTCWPPNALFFTPDRLLIRATEVGAATKGAKLDPGAQFVRTVASTDYVTSAPQALQAQGLTLQQNEAPMGTMKLVNASVAFAQSPGPLSLEAAALQTYFGGLHAGGAAPGRVVGGHGAPPAHAAPAGRGRGDGARRPARRRDRLRGRDARARWSCAPR